MDDPEMTDLTERLARGDDEAAARVFRAYEPYLRMVVRQRLTPRLRAKFDSADIVQSVWVDVLDHVRDGARRFEGPAQLRNFLVRATLNRFIDRIRSHRRAVDRERPMRSGEVGQLADARGASPSQVEQAEDLWRRMLELCPPPHRELLRMKRQGLANSEIAARTGLNPGSVRRILAQLAARLARETGGG
jgi:RNA polymerase sigma-70 factor (ECF subfamily)